MGFTSWWHWAIVAIVLLILFGSKKLPDAARGLGQSLRIFKSEMKEMQKDEGGTAAPSPAQPAPQQQLPSATPAPQQPAAAPEARNQQTA